MAGVSRHDIPQKELKALFEERESVDPFRHLFLTVHIDPATGLTIDQAAVRVLLILCARTIQPLSYETSDERIRRCGRITKLDPVKGSVEFAIPIDLVTPAEGLSHLLNFISCPAEYSYCNQYWVENIELPKTYAEVFKGPRFGSAGVREKLGLRGTTRPLIGVMLKPRHGVSLDQMLPALRAALQGGVDFICDDLLMVAPGPGGLHFTTRVNAMTELVRQVSDDTRQKKSYIANVSTSPLRAIELGSIAIKAGVDALLVNGYGMGFGGLAEIIDQFDGKVPCITSNMGTGIFSRSADEHAKPTGISETVVSKLSRLAGADAVHAGTSASECYGDSHWNSATRALRTPFHHVRSCLAVAEGDLNVANIWENINSLTRDVMLEPTSGILGTPLSADRAAKCFLTLASALDPDWTNEQADKKIQELAKRDQDLRQLLDHYKYAPAKKD